jgi:pimeloyl-ACP methyl ester carboxylesterase
VTVLFLHAFPLDERMWDGERELVADSVAPRLYRRGHTMREWAASVAREAAGDLLLVGASMGGYCALALARAAGDRVRGALLLGARPEADSDERRVGRAKTIELVREQGPDALWRDMVPKLFADERNADERLLYRERDGLVAAVEAIRDRDDSTDVARALGDRLRFVVGEHDPFVTADELREFDVRTLAGAGHLANLERPAEFGELLREFLADV